jgi:glycopeptide antibiotics resistance protein
MGISLLMVVFEKEKITTGKMGKAFLTGVPVIAMLIYEFIQLLTSSLRFDIQDLVFTLVGGVFVWIIQSKIVK